MSVKKRSSFSDRNRFIGRYKRFTSSTAYGQQKPMVEKQSLDSVFKYLLLSHQTQGKTLTSVLHARKTRPSQRLRFNSSRIFTEIEIIHWSQVTPFAIRTVTAVKQGYLYKFHPNQSQKPSSLSDRNTNQSCLLVAIKGSHLPLLFG